MHNKFVDWIIDNGAHKLSQPYGWDNVHYHDIELPETTIRLSRSTKKTTRGELIKAIKKELAHPGSSHFSYFRQERALYKLCLQRPVPSVLCNIFEHREIKTLLYEYWFL